METQCGCRSLIKEKFPLSAFGCSVSAAADEDSRGDRVTGSFTETTPSIKKIHTEKGLYHQVLVYRLFPLPKFSYNTLQRLCAISTHSPHDGAPIPLYNGPSAAYSERNTA